MDNEQSYLTEVFIKKNTLELINPIQNRIINLQQEISNLMTQANKQSQVLQIVNQQFQQRELQDSLNQKNFNEIQLHLQQLEEKQTLAIQTQNQTFTNLIDRVEHQSQQLNERGEKLKEIQNQQQQIKQESNVNKSNNSQLLETLQTRLNQLILSNKEEQKMTKRCIDLSDQKMNNLLDKVNNIIETFNTYTNFINKQDIMDNELQQIIEITKELQRNKINNDDFENKINLQNEYIKSESNTLMLKQQQSLSQNQRLLNQMQQQIDGIQFQRDEIEDQLKIYSEKFNGIKQDLDQSLGQLGRNIEIIKTNQQIQYQCWENTFEGVQKQVEEFKFDYMSIKQNFKKNILKYETIFDDYKNTNEELLKQILQRSIEQYKTIIDDKINQIDVHFEEEFQSISNQLFSIPKSQNYLNEQNNMNKQKNNILKIPEYERKSKKDLNDQQSPLNVMITLNNQELQGRTNSIVDNSIEYQSFSKKQSNSKPIQELNQQQQQIDQLKDQIKQQNILIQLQDKEVKQISEKQKKLHERLEFFCLQTKTQLNKWTAKVENLQDNKQTMIIPDSGKFTELIDLDTILKQIDQFQNQITKLKSDIVVEQNYMTSQLKNLQKFKESQLPKQQEQNELIEQIDYCQKMMIILILHNELVQQTKENNFLKVEQSVNSLNYEYKPGSKDEITHLTYRNQRISKVDFILNNILTTKKTTVQINRNDSHVGSHLLSQSSTIRRQQKQNSLKVNQSVIVGKQTQQTQRLTMRNAMTVEMNQKYLNRKRTNYTTEKLTQSKLYNTISDIE